MEFFREYLEEAEYREHRVSLAWLGRKAVTEFLERFGQEELQLPLILAPERPRAEEHE